VLISFCLFSVSLIFPCPLSRSISILRYTVLNANKCSVMPLNDSSVMLFLVSARVGDLLGTSVVSHCLLWPLERPIHSMHNFLVGPDRPPTPTLPPCPFSGQIYIIQKGIYPAQLDPEDGGSMYL
jgi:hypothetical protein